MSVASPAFALALLWLLALLAVAVFASVRRCALRQAAPGVLWRAFLVGFVITEVLAGFWLGVKSGLPSQSSQFGPAEMSLWYLVFSTYAVLTPNFLLERAFPRFGVSAGLLDALMQTLTVSALMATCFALFPALSVYGAIFSSCVCAGATYTVRLWAAYTALPPLSPANGYTPHAEKQLLQSLLKIRWLVLYGAAMVVSAVTYGQVTYFPHLSKSGVAGLTTFYTMGGLFGVQLALLCLEETLTSQWKQLRPDPKK